MVLGLRGGGYGFFYEAFAGWPIDKPSRFETEEPTFGFQLAYQF
jgi:hemolysin activation/secretion protein